MSTKTMQGVEDSPAVLRLVHEGQSLVEAIARRLLIMFGNADREEFIADGRVGLLIAARRYDGQVGSFSTFARPFIEGAMIDGYRKRAPLPRRAHERLTTDGAAPRDRTAEDSERLLGKHVAGIGAAQVDGVLARLGVDTQGENIAISQKTSAEAASLREELKRLVARCIDSLPAKEACVIRRHWLEEVPIDRVAQELGLPESTTRELHDRARERMKKRLSSLR